MNTDDAREKLVEQGARAYYEWATMADLDGERSRWDEVGTDGGLTHQRFARARTEVILDALLACRDEDGIPLLILRERLEFAGYDDDGERWDNVDLAWYRERGLPVPRPVFRLREDT